MTHDETNQPPAAPAEAVIDAFLDGEPCHVEELKRVLAQPTARDYLADVLVLRQRTRDMGPIAYIPPVGSRSTGGWGRVVAAAVFVAGVGLGYVAGLRGGASGPPIREAVVRDDGIVAPAPTRTITLEPGVNWTSYPEEN